MDAASAKACIGCDLGARPRARACCLTRKGRVLHGRWCICSGGSYGRRVKRQARTLMRPRSWTTSISPPNSRIE
jgi:hypothetical protein